MKKIMMLFVAMMLVVGFTGQAMADYATGDLIRVVYQVGGALEQITDLGAVSSYTTPFTTNIQYNTNTFSLSTFAGASYSDLQVAYFVYNANNTAFVSGPYNGTQLSGSRQNSAYNSNALAVVTVAKANSGGSGNAIIAQSNGQSYMTKMDKGGGTSTGTFGGFIPGGNGEANLAALATVGYVDQSLFYYSNTANAANGVNVATIRTYADGSTQLNPQAVAQTPIPAAVYLLGSGLLGLVGIRRKMAA
jgi:hypothetical protein